MSLYAQGQRVNVMLGYPTGLGTVHDIYGGPGDVQYRILMDYRGDDGQRVMVPAQDIHLEPADPIQAYAPLQRVTYLGRGATITDIARSGDLDDPRDDMLYVLCDRDPPEIFSGVEHEYIFVMPSWKLHAYAK